MDSLKSNLKQQIEDLNEKIEVKKIYTIAHILMCLEFLFIKNCFSLVKKWVIISFITNSSFTCKYVFSNIKSKSSIFLLVRHALIMWLYNQKFKIPYKLNYFSYHEILLTKRNLVHLYKPKGCRLYTHTEVQNICIMMNLLRILLLFSLFINRFETWIKIGVFNIL